MENAKYSLRRLCCMVFDWRKPYSDWKGKAYIKAPKKYYFSDLGLRNARIHFRQFEQTHSIENVICNELHMRGYSVDVGVVTIQKDWWFFQKDYYVTKDIVQPYYDDYGILTMNIYGFLLAPQILEKWWNSIWQTFAGIPIDHSFLKYKKELSAYGWKRFKVWSWVLLSRCNNYKHRKIWAITSRLSG